MLANFVDVLFQVFFVLILIDILSSWVLAARVNLPAFVYTILGAVHSIVTPVLSPFRRIIPSIGGLDFSPIIALFVLQFAQQFITRALRGGF
jgi:YggT family protein